jgi:hypothetical protein
VAVAAMAAQQLPTPVEVEVERATVEVPMVLRVW